MIRIERGAEASPGVWEYSIPSLRLCGKSRQPLLDGCRQIKLMGGHTGDRAGVFRNGSDVPDITSTVDAAAKLTVSEPNKGGVRFVEWRPFNSDVFREAAE